MLKIVKIDEVFKSAVGVSAAVCQLAGAEWTQKEQPVTDTISDSSVDPSDSDPSEREFGPSGISLSPYRFPTGWFIVGFA
jgi:hypothetical protein